MAQTVETGPTLTHVTHLGRQTVKFGLITLVVLIVGRMVLTAAVNYYRAVNPPPPPPPTVGFGLLPRIEFPTTTSDQVTSYRLETANGRLATFGDRAKVFFMPKPTLGLLTDEKVKKIAAKYDFVFAPEVLDTRTYRWKRSQPLETTFQIDAVNFNFTFQTDFLSRSDLLVENKVPQNADAVTRVKAMLSAAELLPLDMATAAGEAVYLKALGGELQPAAAYSDADYVQIDLNRTPVDDAYRMFSPEGYKGSVQAIVSALFSGNDSIVRLEYNYHPVDKTEVHTYPLRTTDSAWKLLQAGEGYIATPGDSATAVVREVVLGYFDSFKEQPYLQPIYVFIGDGGFLGYVPALDPKYVQTATE